jgi:integrase
VASLYPKQRSPFWYIEYRDPLNGKPRNESTKFRRDDREQTRKARQLCAQRTADELGIAHTRRGEDWESWVPAFLQTRYANPLTLLRAQAAWFALSTYFRAKQIGAPRVLGREQCMNYVAWRTSDEGRALGLRKAQHNTARVELQFLSAIMREAVLRGKATANPCLQLGIVRVQGKIKPEISDEQIEVIERQLLAEAGQYDYNEAMQTSWAIAMLHVCRLSETCVDLNNIDLGECTITFDTKGGRPQTKLLHPELVPLFERLKKERRRFAYDMPRNFSKKWKYFFNRCGFPELSFHSTRVTGVTRLRRMRVDPRVAQDYVGHSSVIVHRIYQRWRPDDHAAAVNALSRVPAVPANAGEPSSNERPRKRSN